MRKALFGLVVICVIGTASAEALNVVIPPNWDPDVDVQTVSEWSEAGLKGPSGDIPQQGLNRYLAMLADVWDSKLMLAYIQLSAKTKSSEKESLAKEQHRWLAKREAESRKAQQSEAGGTAAPAAYSQTFIDLTKKRYQEICDRSKSR